MKVDTEREYKQVSQLEHVKLRPNMYIGSVSLQTNQIYTLNEDEENPKFVLNDIEFSPGLLKIFDEILVNAIDHHINYPKLVKNITIEFNIETGEITVENDGSGISIILVDTLNDGKVYKPQAIFSQFLGGDNLTESTERIVGGMNGLGSKVSNSFSTSFTVETYDTKSKKLYTQTFLDRLNIIEKPVITNGGDDNYGHTKITFLPSYEDLGYDSYNKETMGKTIMKLLELRAYQTVAFLDNSCKIHFNDYHLVFDIDCKTPNFGQFSEMFINNEYGMYNTTLVHPENKLLNMDISLGISDGKLHHVSIINGINVYEGGTHVKYISDEIVKNIKPKVESALTKTKSKFNANFILNNLFIFIKCSVFNPEFNSQSKEKLTTPIDKFTSYKFKEKEWKKIWEFLEPHVMESILGKLKDKTKTRVTRSKIFLTKGNDAKFAGDKKKAVECSLFIAEGDSALGLLETGINHKKTELNRDYYGTWSIQGVCPNARKEVSTILDKKNDKVIRVRNAKLRDNKRFDELVHLLGLDYEKQYLFNTKEGDLEFKTLRYGRIVVATDADTDGKGMIFGLIMNFFGLFWPELVKRGYLKRFNTPIIRAYPKNVKEIVREFYALHIYETWIKDNFEGNDELAAEKYDIKYYKGLAGNSASEIKPMFNNFETKLNTYNHDIDAEENLEVYFGKDTNPRKEVLSTPVNIDDIIKCDISNNIEVSEFLKTDVKEFQRDNIIRKLPNIIDGMVPSRRKAFFGARLNKKMASKEVKVVNFTGEVISKTGYTHGDASLSGTIIKMAQSFVGAKNLPLLIGVGNFGSRRAGGSDHGSPRYVSIKINKALSNSVFPTQDDFLLSYMFEDGVRVEPTYYIPVIPMSILESMQIPATGWRVKIWARDFTSVIKNVRKMINGTSTKCKKLKPWLRGNNCDLRMASDGKEFMVGKYTYNKATNIIKITELPISVYNNRYIKAVAFNKDGTLIKELKNCEDYSNYDEATNIDEINIELELVDGGMELIKNKYDEALKLGKKASSKKSIIISDDAEPEIQSYDIDTLFDPIEEFFKLRLRIDSDLNMIDQKGEVRELEYYGTVVNIWFEERKQLYKERIERYIILSNLMIKYLENIIRFSVERDSLNITNKTLENDFNNILKKNKYDTFNKTMLFSPKYCKVEELDNCIINNTENNTNYDYIINLSYKVLLKEACEKRAEELNSEKLILANYLKDDIRGKTLVKSSDFTGQKTWLLELDNIEKIVNKGTLDGWDKKAIMPKFE